jgi:hypothetical protein
MVTFAMIRLMLHCLVSQASQFICWAATGPATHAPARPQATDLNEARLLPFMRRARQGAAGC